MIHKLSVLDKLLSISNDAMPLPQTGIYNSALWGSVNVYKELSFLKTGVRADVVNNVTSQHRQIC